jgi:hypothetical protein
MDGPLENLLPHAVICGEFCIPFTTAPLSQNGTMIPLMQPSRETALASMTSLFTERYRF